MSYSSFQVVSGQQGGLQTHISSICSFHLPLAMNMETHAVKTHTHTHTHLLSLLAHTYTYHATHASSCYPCLDVYQQFFFSSLQKKLTAVPQKSKQFTQGYLDRPSIHSWEPEPPGGFIMRRLLILGFPLEMLDEFHFIQLVSEMARMAKWPNQRAIVYCVWRKQQDSCFLRPG